MNRLLRISAGLGPAGARRAVRCLVVVVLLGGVPGPDAAAPEDVREASTENNAGVRSLEADQLDEAIGHFERARLLSPEENTIRENLAGAYKARGVRAEEAGSFDDAERDYRAALNLDPHDPQPIRMLAVLANNRATAAVGARRMEEARGHFFRALEYLPRISDTVAARNIKTNYAKFLTLEGDGLESAGRIAKARASYQEALRYNPSDSIALTALGDLDYDDDRYVEALGLYSRALAAASVGRPDLSSLLSQRLDTLRREMAVERDFVKIVDRQGRFRLFVPRDFAPTASAQILQTLDEAYARVGRDFDFHTSRSFTAKVYTRDQLEAIQQIPAWVVGIYDGKLRLLEEQLLNGRARLRNLIYHEYAHSVIHQMGGRKTPSWLHEGLAQIAEPESSVGPREVRYLAARVRSRRDTPLREMTEPFPRTKAREKMPLIYLKARLVVDYLLKKHDWVAMRRLLRETRRLDDFDAAFSATYAKSVEEIEADWRRWMRGDR